MKRVESLIKDERGYVYIYIKYYIIYYNIIIYIYILIIIYYNIYIMVPNMDGSEESGSNQSANHRDRR